jgi:hypothetical protein
MRSQVLINDAIYFIIPVLHVLLTSDTHANYITYQLYHVDQYTTAAQQQATFQYFENLQLVIAQGQ